jgi:acyl carrier protein
VSEEEILHCVCALIGKLLDRPGFVAARTTKIAAIEGWDSMKQVMLVLAIEERFGIRLRNPDIARLKSVGDAVEIIGAKKAVLF